MKILFVCLFILTISFSYAFFKKEEVLELSNLSYSLYDYEAISIDGDIVKLSDYKGKKIIIVNVASKCGYTYQYEGLQSLYSKYKDDIVVLGFPANYFLLQEPGNDEAPSWNFCKYLINEEGNLINFLTSSVKPLDKEIISFIENE